MAVQKRFWWVGIILICSLTFSVRAQTAETLVYGVQSRTETVTPGYVLFAPIAGRSAYLMDNEGRVIHQWDSPDYILTTHLLADGSILVSSMPQFAAGETGRVDRYDWDGNLLWSFAYPHLHHDIEPMPNGHILMTIWDRIPVNDMLALGMNPDLLPRPDPIESTLPDGTMWLEKIIEVDPQTSAIVWEWKVSDHLIQDYDPALPNYGSPADYPGRIDMNYATARLPVDRIHINSVAYNPALNQIMLSAHYYSEIWVIDHATTSETAAGAAGDLLYRWGNPAAYGRGGAADRQLFFQHHAHWLANGDILVFNNGMPIFRPYSSVDAITPPLQPDGHYVLPDSAAYGPEASIQQYNPPERFYSSAFGGAQTLPDGHLLITQGTVGRIFEVDAAGEVVWDYFVPIFTFPSNVNRSSIFRAQRILPDDPALAGRNLIPGGVIPLTLPDDSTGG